MDPDVGAARADNRCRGEPERTHPSAVPARQDRGGEHGGAGVARGECRGRRLPDLEPVVARSSGALAAEQALDALVHHEALDTEESRQYEDLIGAAAEEAARDAEDVPDQAEVAHMAGCAEHGIGEGMTAELFEELVGAFVETVDDWPELTLPGNIVG